VGTFGISRDITLRKRAEQALAERTEQLRERNQQMQEDLNMARELQLAMLPQRFPVVPHNVPQADSALRFFSFYLPSGAVSGDFFDVIPLSDTSVGVFVCDVMGHDVRAALITAMMRALVEELGPVAGDPGQLLTQMNRDLCGLFRQTTATMFATACYLVADVARGKLLYASAGHPSPLHLHRSAGTVGPVVADDERGPALGLLMENVTYRTSQRPMMPGDLIMLFTDGLFEIENSSRETYGQQRLLAAALQHIGLPPSELFDTLIDEVREFAANRQFTDDVCLLGMEIARLSPT
jgi:serine phosphatase RsbU (regulator of sigma subunit)